MNLEDKLLSRLTPYQLGWLAEALPLALMAIAVLIFVLSPLIAVIPMFAGLGLSLWLTVLSVCPECGTPGVDRYHGPTRQCRKCGHDLTVMPPCD